jgi:DNA-3-methyladenine glycosylase II
VVSLQNKLPTEVIFDNASVHRAELFLSQADPILGKLIQLHGPCTICFDNIDPFVKLVSSIIGQQLSAKAARTIRKRVFRHLAEITPGNIISADHGALRACGLSNAKIRYIKNLSELTVNNAVNFSVLYELPAEVAITELTKIKGIGRWTAEMFALFTLHHSDILSLGDASLNRAVKKLYGDTAKLEIIGKKWKPFCSVASWYLWRYIDAGIEISIPQPPS